MNLDSIQKNIFFDRYAEKEFEPTYHPGDLVVFKDEDETKHIGRVSYIDGEDIYVSSESSFSQHTNYRRHSRELDKPREKTIEDTWTRIAAGAASVEEESEQVYWAKKFYSILKDFIFIPGGRIMTKMGTKQELTNFNCYVLPCPKDSREGLIEQLKDMVNIMARGGGVGFNISSARPRNCVVKGVNGRSSGSVSWADMYSFVTNLVEQAGNRRGALMLQLGDWHPDIEEFICVKQDMSKINHANISVAVSDDFMKAVKEDLDWDLYFPDTASAYYNTEWNGDIKLWKEKGYPIIKYKTVKAKELWNKIVESAWKCAEPGLFFIDRANNFSNSYYYGKLLATNPCGEEPLIAYAVCNLGAINLSKFVEDNIFQFEKLETVVEIAVRFLDNAIDESYYFDERYKKTQKSERRLGLGIMGLAEAMIKMKIRYGSQKSIKFVEKIMETIRNSAYKASITLAEEKGSFKNFEADKFCKSGFVKTLPKEIIENIKEKGIRNVTLLTVAPTGTTGTLVRTSTGIEPFFLFEYLRNSSVGKMSIKEKVYEEYLKENGSSVLPDYFITSQDLSPKEHVEIMATVQRYVDASISKTVNCPSNYTIEQVAEIYQYMYDLGCKGGTIYRDGSRDKQILESKKEENKPKNLKIEYVEDYPEVRKGTTYSVETPVGKAHITVNEKDSSPIECFVEVGKAGSDLVTFSEALGRLTSLVLRLNSPVPRKERMQLIAEQLEGIGGARTVGFGPNRIHSLPDAVAKILKRYYVQEEAENSDELKTLEKPITSDLCPSCGNHTFLRVEGCHTCSVCGYSEC